MILSLFTGIYFIQRVALPEYYLVFTMEAITTLGCLYKDPIICYIYFTGYHRQSGFLGHEHDANCNHQIEPNDPNAPLEITDYNEMILSLFTGIYFIQRVALPEYYLVFTMEAITTLGCLYKDPTK
jgi:hypothetical protein